MRKFFILIVVTVSLYLGITEVQESFTVKTPMRRESPHVVASIPVFTNKMRETASTPREFQVYSALDVASKYIENHREEWKIQPYHELRPVEFKTPLGTKITYSVYQDGVPVLDLGIRFQIDNKLAIESVENGYKPIERANLPRTPSLIRDLVPLLGDRYKVAENLLTVASPVLVLIPGTLVPQVAYQINVSENGREKRNVEVLFRGSDGHVLGKNHPRSEF